LFSFINGVLPIVSRMLFLISISFFVIVKLRVWQVKDQCWVVNG